MTDLDGRQFTRSSGSSSDAKYYYIGGNLPLRNIPFRVCANSTSCDLSQGEYVPEAGKWYLQDQIGFEDKSTADFVGVDKGSGGDIVNEWFLTKTDSGTKPNQAALVVGFTAKLKCLFAKCAPCVRLESNSSLSPAGRLGILPWIGANAPPGEAFRLVYNIDSCFPIIFHETNCVNRL